MTKNTSVLETIFEELSTLELKHILKVADEQARELGNFITNMDKNSQSVKVLVESLEVASFAGTAIRRVLSGRNGRNSVR